MRISDITSGRVDLSRRAVERGGWLSSLYTDPGADPPWEPEELLRVHPVREPDEPRTDAR